MSRIGKMPIPIPAGVAVEVGGSGLMVRGPKGELQRSLHPAISFLVEDGKIVVTRPSDSKLHRSLHGLTRTLISNMVQGVTQGFEKALDVVGVGYRVQKKNEGVVFQLGFTHPVEFFPPPGISLIVDGPNRLRVQGADRELVGQVAAKLRAISPPDYYKGKGIRYMGEQVRLKPGKAGKAAKK